MRNISNLEDKNQRVEPAILMDYSDVCDNDITKNDGYNYYNNYSIITSNVTNASLESTYENHQNFKHNYHKIKETHKNYEAKKRNIFDIVHTKWLECIGTPFSIKRWDVLEEFLEYNKDNSLSKIDDCLLLHKVNNKYEIEDCSKGIRLFFEGKIDFKGIYLDDLIFKITNENTFYEVFEFCFEKNMQLNYSIISRKDAIIPHLKFTLIPISVSGGQKMLIQICYCLKENSTETNKTGEDGMENSSDNKLFRLMTQREREVVQLVLEGNKNTFIAEKLCIKEGTVKKIIYNVYRKFCISSRPELINLFSKNKEKLI